MQTSSTVADGTATIPAWNDPSLKEMLVAEALMILVARLAGGRIWRLQKGLSLVACLIGVAYGLLMELDERRKGRERLVDAA